MVISDEILEQAHASEAEVRAEIALVLFAQERIDIAQAARLAGLPQREFEALLTARASGTAFLSESALAADWNRPEEDEAWAHLQRAS